MLHFSHKNKSEHLGVFSSGIFGGAAGFKLIVNNFIAAVTESRN